MYCRITIKIVIFLACGLLMYAAFLQLTSKPDDATLPESSSAEKFADPKTTALLNHSQMEKKESKNSEE